jgi:hypothetical protein
MFTVACLESPASSLIDYRFCGLRRAAWERMEGRGTMTSHAPKPDPIHGTLSIRRQIAA